MYAVTWAGGALRNTWVEVTVKANADSGLAAPDVFYFGNLVGETGDAATPLRVSALDLAGTKGHFTSDAPITSRYDFNRDGAVNALDLAAVRANYGRSLVAIVAPPPPPDGVAEPTPLASITEQVLG